MKHLWIAAGILILLAAAALVNVAHLSAMTEDLALLLVQAQEEAEQGDRDQAADLTRRASDCFETHSFYLHVTLHHEDIDAVTLSFREVLGLLTGEDAQAEYAAANTRLIAQLRLLAEAEQPTVHNIL